MTQSVVVSKAKEPIVAASIYLACRMEGYPRTLEEVAKFTQVDGAALSRMQGLIARALTLPIGQAQVTPESLVNRVAGQLQLPHTIATHARAVCAAVSRYELFTSSPQTVVGGALLWVCLLSRIALDVEALAAATLVSPAALRQMFGKMQPSLAVLLPRELKTSFGDSWRNVPANLEKAACFVQSCAAAKPVVVQPVGAASTSSSMSAATSSESFTSSPDADRTVDCGGLSQRSSNASLASQESRGSKRRADGREVCSERFIEKHGSIFIPKKPKIARPSL